MNVEQHKAMRKSELAMQRRKFKNQLVKLKAKDEISAHLFRKLDEEDMTIKELKIFLKNGVEHRAVKRKELNNLLDTMERVNPKGEY